LEKHFFLHQVPWSIPNCISIGSAVFAKLTVHILYSVR